MTESNKLYSTKELRAPIPYSYGVYKWWCKKEMLEKILKKLDICFDECISDIEKRDEYYCVYVGETSCLNKRITCNHINGKIKNSTLRKTIAAVLIGKTDEDTVNRCLDEFYVEWHEFNKEEYHEEQNRLINLYFRPFNNKDICRNNEKYSEKRHYKITKNERRSEKIKELKKKIKQNYK